MKAWRPFWSVFESNIGILEFNEGLASPLEENDKFWSKNV